MNSNDEHDDNEVVYDVTNIEELDHFDIGEDAPVLDIPADQINVLDYIENSESTERSRSRRASSKVVHVLNRMQPSTSAKPKSFVRTKSFAEHSDGTEKEDDSEVIMEPASSVSRIFVTAPQDGLHMDLYLLTKAAEPFNSVAEIIITQGANVDPSQICRNVPQEFTSTGTFVVDMSNISNRSEISLDGLGSWGSPQGSSKFFKVRQSGQIMQCAASDSYAWKVLCNRYTHPGTEPRGMFYKKIYTGITNEGVPSQIAVIVYAWSGEPHAISVNAATIPHVAGIKERPFGNKSWEGRLENIFHDECLSYRELPVFSRTCVDFETACRILLSHDNIQEERICFRIPTDFRECGTFVLDISRCGGERSLCRDGRDWNKPSGSSRFFRTDEHGNTVRADINNTHPGEHFDIQVLLKRYETINPIGLIRKIYIAKNKSRTLASPLAVITYMYKAPGVSKTSISAGRPVQLAPLTKKRPYPVDARETGSPIQVTEEADEYDMYELKRKMLELQTINIDRFSSFLDRAENIMDRLEQSGSQYVVPLTRQLVHAWRNGDPQVQQQQDDSHFIGQFVNS